MSLMLKKVNLYLTFRGGTETPFGNEDLDYGSISMPVLMSSSELEQFKPDVYAELGQDSYITWFYGGSPEGLKQVPNKEYRKYPGLSMLAMAKANAAKIRNASPGTVGLTNIDGPDLIGHVAAKNIEDVTELFVEKPDGTFEIKEGDGWASALECLKIADTSIGIVLKAIEEQEGVGIIVGDHGSVDDMTQPSHSFNDVPIFVIDFKNRDVRLVKAEGDIKDTQADVAVTILHILGIDKPEEMTGKSLLPDDYAGSRGRVVWQIILDGFGHTDFNSPDNAFAVAMNKGMMPVIKSLYDEDNFVILKAAGGFAGLRGGKQEEFVTTNDSTLLSKSRKLDLKALFLDKADTLVPDGDDPKIEDENLEALIRTLEAGLKVVIVTADSKYDAVGEELINPLVKELMRLRRMNLVENFHLVHAKKIGPEGKTKTINRYYHYVQNNRVGKGYDEVYECLTEKEDDVVNKREAIELLIAKLGISSGSIIVVTDSPKDEAMFEASMPEGVTSFNVYVGTEKVVEFASQGVIVSPPDLKFTKATLDLLNRAAETHKETRVLHIWHPIYYGKDKQLQDLIRNRYSL